IVMLVLVTMMVILVILVRPANDGARPPAALQGDTQAEPGGAAPPDPPFAIAAPPEPSPKLDDIDLRSQDPEGLAGAARGAGREGNWDVAVQLQHWTVARGQDGQYNLACYYSRAGRVDAAIYWLQRAALEEGADADWAEQDTDLEAVR